jgi:hypothetical protein
LVGIDGDFDGVDGVFARPGEDVGGDCPAVAEIGEFLNPKSGKQERDPSDGGIHTLLEEMGFLTEELVKEFAKEIQRCLTLGLMELELGLKLELEHLEISQTETKSVELVAYNYSSRSQRKRTQSSQYNEI